MVGAGPLVGGVEVVPGTVDVVEAGGSDGGESPDEADGAAVPQATTRAARPPQRTRDNLDIVFHLGVERTELGSNHQTRRPGHGFPVTSGGQRNAKMVFTGTVSSVSSPAVNVEQRMRHDLLEAMKRRDVTTVRALRNMLGVIGNAEAVDPQDQAAAGPGQQPPSEVGRRVLTEDHRQMLVAEQISRLRRTASQLRRLHRADEAAELAQELAVLASYARSAQTD